MFKRNRKKRSSSDVINIDSASYAMEQYKTISANIEFLEIDDNYKRKKLHTNENITEIEKVIIKNSIDFRNLNHLYIIKVL